MGITYGSGSVWICFKVKIRARLSAERFTGYARLSNTLFDLPNHNERYQALLNRNPRFEGQTYVALLTTAMFCRLTSPARKPKPENCSF